MKLLAFALVLLLSGTEAFAINGDSLRTEVICEAGYKFLVVYSSQSKNSSPSVTQIMEITPNSSRPQPMKCK